MKVTEANSLEKTNQIIFQIYKEISESPIEKDGEGAVVYFV